MERFLCPKTDEDQRSFPRLRTIFMSEHTSSPKSNQTYSACQWGRGLISILVQISVLRLLKTLYFAYSVCQCGEGYSSPRPPLLATLPAFGAWRHRPQSLVCATLSLLVTLHHWRIFQTKKLSVGHRSSVNKLLVGVPAACYTWWRVMPQNSVSGVTILSDGYFKSIQFRRFKMHFISKKNTTKNTP